MDNLPKNPKPKKNKNTSRGSKSVSSNPTTGGGYTGPQPQPPEFGNSSDNSNSGGSQGSGVVYRFTGAAKAGDSASPFNYGQNSVEERQEPQTLEYIPQIP